MTYRPRECDKSSFVLTGHACLADCSTHAKEKASDARAKHTGLGAGSKEDTWNNHPLELYSSRVFLFKFNQPPVNISTTQFQLFLILYIIFFYFFFCRNRYCSKLLQETMISLLSERLRIWRLRQTENMTTSPSFTASFNDSRWPFSMWRVSGAWKTRRKRE